MIASNTSRMPNVGFFVFLPKKTEQRGNMKMRAWESMGRYHHSLFWRCQSARDECHSVFFLFLCDGNWCFPTREQKIASVMQCFITGNANGCCQSEASKPTVSQQTTTSSSVLQGRVLLRQYLIKTTCKKCRQLVADSLLVFVCHHYCTGVHLKQQLAVSSCHQGRCVAALGSLSLLPSETYLGISGYKRIAKWRDLILQN